MHNLTQFISSHSHYFYKYDTLSDIQPSSNKKWLYIFNTSYRNEDTSTKLPSNSFKLGKTSGTIRKRLSEYNAHIEMKDIECIQCTYPTIRELLLKKFLSEKTSNKPVCGTEYFSDCRDYVKVIILIIVSLHDSDIISFENYFHANKSDYTMYLTKIYDIYNNILNTEGYTLNINTKGTPALNVIRPLVGHICRFCKKVCSSEKELQRHQLNTKYCIRMQSSVRILKEDGYDTE